MPRMTLSSRSGRLYFCRADDGETMNWGDYGQ